MVKYAKVVDGVVVSYPYENLFKDNPNVSFSIPLDQETLKNFNTVEVHDTTKPIVNIGQTCVETSPIFDGEIWRTQWKIIDIEDEDVIEKIKNAWASVRKQRNQLLKDSDWTMLDDSNKDKKMWAMYRNELRKLPERQDDPFNINWPTPPEELNS